MAANWPTHKIRARKARNAKLAQKKRNRKIRRLHKDGKRGEISVNGG